MGCSQVAGDGGEEESKAMRAKAYESQITNVRKRGRRVTAEVRQEQMIDSC